MAVDQTINRARRLVAKAGWSKSRLALAAELSINTLRGIDREDWNPSAETLRKLESAIREAAQPRRKPAGAEAAA